MSKESQTVEDVIAYMKAKKIDVEMALVVLQKASVCIMAAHLKKSPAENASRFIGQPQVLDAMTFAREISDAMAEVWLLEEAKGNEGKGPE